MTVLDDIHRMEAADAPQLQVGLVVHEALRREGRRIELGDTGVRVYPMLKQSHPLRPWLWELGEYARQRCTRCDSRFPHSGLRMSVWGAWYCQDCCQRVGAVGGTLDRDGWPQAERTAA